MLGIVLCLLASVEAAKIAVDCGGVKSFRKWQTVSPPAEEYTLVQAHSFIRHGDRTTATSSLCWADMSLTGDWNCSQSVRLAPHNNDPNSLHSKWMEFELARLKDIEVFPGNCFHGQLTRRGYQMHVDNGLGLRSRYVDYYKLLPADLNEALAEAKSKGVSQKVYKIRADDKRRVLHSGMALFTGLFAKKDSPLNYEEIAVWTADKDWEYMFPNANVCPCYEEHLQQSLASERMTRYLAKHLPMVAERLDPIMYGGVKHRDLLGQYFMIWLAYDCATVYTCHNKAIPASMSQWLYNEVTNMSSFRFYSAYNYPDKVRGSICTVGPLLKLLKYRLMQAVADPSAATAWYLYSGHDTGPMMPMLAALGFSEWNLWTPYASLLSFELFRDGSGEYFVGTSFEDSPLALSWPCDASSNPYSLCSFHKFLAFIEPMVATDVDCPGMDPWKSAMAGGKLGDKMRGIFEKMRDRKLD